MPTKSKIQDHTFLFTGTLTEFTRDEAESLVATHGGKVLSGVSGKLNYLVVGEDAGSKLEKANALGTVTILTEKEFLKMVPKGDSSSSGKTSPKKVPGKSQEKASPTSVKKGSSSLETFEEVRIGKQIWMAKNLAVTKFKNGDEIPIIKSEKEWKSCYESKKPAACFFKNDIKNKDVYGVLYNWYAVIDKRGLAPDSWRVPSLDDWKELIGTNDVKKFGAMLKSKLLWPNPQKNKDSFGLSIIPTGIRIFGEFSSDLDSASFWTSTEAMSGYSMKIGLEDNSSKLDWGSVYHDSGLAVRLIKK